MPEKHPPTASTASQDSLLAALSESAAPADFWEIRTEDFLRDETRFSNLSAHWNGAHSTWSLWWDGSDDGRVPDACLQTFKSHTRKAYAGLAREVTNDAEPWQLWLDELRKLEWHWKVTRHDPVSENVWAAGVNQGIPLVQVRKRLKLSTGEEQEPVYCWLYSGVISSVFTACRLLCNELHARTLERKVFSARAPTIDLPEQDLSAAWGALELSSEARGRISVACDKARLLVGRTPATLDYLDAIAWELVCVKPLRNFESLIFEVCGHASAVFGGHATAVDDRRKEWLTHARERFANGIVAGKIPVRIDPARAETFGELKKEFRALPDTASLMVMFLDPGRAYLCSEKAETERAYSQLARRAMASLGMGFNDPWRTVEYWLLLLKQETPIGLTIADLAPVSGDFCEELETRALEAGALQIGTSHPGPSRGRNFEFWRDMEAQFRALPNAATLTASLVGDAWVLDGGAENGMERKRLHFLFEALATRAGVAAGVSDLAGWLNLLMLETPHFYGIRPEGGWIENLALASAEYCVARTTTAFAVERVEEEFRRGETSHDKGAAAARAVDAIQLRNSTNDSQRQREVVRSKPILDTRLIIKWMEDEGWENETLAKKLDVSPRTISSLRNNGTYHGKEALTKLANLMNRDSEALYLPEAST